MNDFLESPTLPHSYPPDGPMRLPDTCEPPSEQNPAEEASWLIFGADGETGETLARTALAHGDNVTAVGWTGESTADEFSQQWNGSSSIGLLCDVRVRESVEAVTQRSIQRWGHIDIIAICIGYGVIAACEDQTEHEIRNQFETNFMGTLNILQLSLPHFRDQLHGRYLVLSSTAGSLGMPGLGPFCATKYAIEALVESMLYEVDCFGIKATLIEPGHARIIHSSAAEDDNAATDAVPEASPPQPSKKPLQRRRDGGGVGSGFYAKEPPSAPYAGKHAPARHFLRTTRWLAEGQQQQQPQENERRNAELVWQLGHCSYPPLRLVLGSYAAESVRDRLRSLIEEAEDWKYLNFPTGAEESSSLAQDVEMA